MALTTRSQFFYGLEITSDNNFLDFKENGGPELSAEIDIGAYTLTDLAAAVSSALNGIGDLDWSCTVDRTTRKLTISVLSGNFDLLCATGTHVSIGAWSTIGYNASDRVTQTSVVADNAIASIYRPQFILQKHVSTVNNLKSANASVNKSASGRVQVQRFGEERMLECEFKFITDVTQPGSGPIENNPFAVSEARAFMDYAIQKKPMEFMPNRDDPSVFDELILESTPESQDGVGYKLKELYAKNMPYYFETGLLKFRVQ